MAYKIGAEHQHICSIQSKKGVEVQRTEILYLTIRHTDNFIFGTEIADGLKNVSVLCTFMELYGMILFYKC